MITECMLAIVTLLAEASPAESSSSQAQTQAPHQESSAPAAPSPWTIPGLSLRFSKKDKNQADKPAQFQYTNPSGGDNSYSIDAGLTYDISKALGDTPYDLNVSAEVHKNTTLKKEQDSRLLGATIRRAWPDAFFGSLMPSLSLENKNDEIKDSGTLIGTIKVPFLFQGTPLSSIDGTDKLKWAPRAGVGFEWNDVYDAPSSGPTGHVGRGLAYAECQLFWKPEFRTKENDKDEEARFGERQVIAPAVLTIDAQGWRDMTESSALDDGRDDHFIFHAGLAWFFDSGRHFALSIDYTHGENPTLGLDQQQFVQIGISAIF